MKKKVSLILLIVLTLSLGITLIGCTTKDDSSIKNFDISKSFKLINSTTINENQVQLIVSGNSEINEYMKTLRENFKNENLKFEIYIFDESEKEFNIYNNDFKNLRMKIDFNTNNVYYTQNKYVIVPNMDSYTKILPFKNENVEIINDIFICKIEVDSEESIEDILSTAKIYSEQVKELNNRTTGVKIVINDKYIYESNDYLILMEKINL